MIKYLINAISKGLAFSKNEARGTFVLAILIVLVVGFSKYEAFRIKSKSPETYDSTLLASWVAEVESSYSIKKVPSKQPTSTSTFDHKEPTPPKKVISETRIEKPKELVILDLNTSSADELQRVKGIGKTYSERIVKYRNKLGGFSSLEQLSEVYGMNQELIEKIGSQFSIQTKNKPLLINSDSVKILIRHPYISYDLAWVLINYRQQNGDIQSFEELKKIKAIDDSLLLKLRPYIK